MATLIEDLQAVLHPLCTGGSWYIVSTAQPPVYPYITFQRIVSDINVNFLSPSDLQNTRIQVDVWAQRISEAAAIADAAEAALLAYSPRVIPLSSQDTFEETVRVFRVMRDYSIWSTN